MSDNKIPTTGGAKVPKSLFEDEISNWEPKTKADQKVLAELQSIDPGHVYEARKDPSSNIPTKKDFKILDPVTGKFNLASSTRGVTVTTMRLVEKDDDVEATKSITAFEDSWGVHCTVDRTGYKGIKEGPSKYFDVKTISLKRDDAVQERDSNMKELVKLDLKDDRKARSDRLAKFSEAYGPDLVNIPKILDVKPVLLDDDVVLHSFKCRKIAGLPVPNKNVINQGSVVVSLVRNVKLNRLRLHFSYAEASTDFKANEKFEQAVSTTSSSEMGTGTTVESLLEVAYEQTSTFKGGECFIPIDTTSTFMSNALVYRSAGKKLSMTAKGQKSNALSVAVASTVANLFGGTFTVFACADRIRLGYYYCSARCINKMGCCCSVEEPSSAEYSHKKTVEFNATDSFILGGPTNWEEKAFHPSPLQTTTKPNEIEHWQPKWCFEHTGNWSWKCCVFVPEKAETLKTNNAPTTWNVKKEENDDIVLEFTYKPIPSFFRLAQGNKLTMTLDTAGQDADDVYNAARKMVAVIGVEFGEAYEAFEIKEKQHAKEKLEKEKADLEKQEAEAKAKALIEGKRLEVEAEIAEKKAIEKQEAAIQRENNRALYKAAAEEAIQEKVLKRAKEIEEAEFDALKKLSEKLKVDNKKSDYLAYNDFLEKRKTTGEPKWGDNAHKNGTLNMSLDLSGVSK